MNRSIAPTLVLRNLLYNLLDGELGLRDRDHPITAIADKKSVEPNEQIEAKN